MSKQYTQPLRPPLDIGDGQGFTIWTQETVTHLLADRLWAAHQGSNRLPGEVGVWVEGFEVEADSAATAKTAAEAVVQPIRYARARFDGAGLTVEGLQEIRKLPLSWAR